MRCFDLKKWGQKQKLLMAVLVMLMAAVIWQKDLIANDRRWVMLLGMVVCGMVFVAIPWESIQKQIDKKWNDRLDINRFLSRCIFLLSPVFAFYLVQVFGGFTDKKFLKLLFSVRGGCNLILYAALGYFLYVVCNRAKYAALLLVIISAVFGLANYFVILFRDSPILAADLFSIGTAMDVAAGYEYQLNSETMKALVLTVVLCCVILRQSSYRWLGWKKRVLLFGGALVVYAVLSSYFFSGTFFRKHGISLNIWKPKSNYAANGSLVSLAVSFSYYHVEKPQDYSVENVKNLTSDYVSDEKETAGIQPNVIAIMNEAFSDMSVLGNLKISEDVMPFVRNLHDDTVKGTLYVSVRSSQTANSEFEFLTGCTMAFLPYRSIPYNSYVKLEMPTLTTTLKEQGYGSNLAFHPGIADAWNRDKVYPLFGFDDYHAYGDIAGELQEEDIVHGFPSDLFGYQHLISEYETFRKSSERPFYSFFVTIQNHGGYEVNPVDVKIPLKNAKQWGKGLEQYLNLIKISDDSFEEIVNYFKDIEEPTVIVMFGDHQPGIEPKKRAKTYSSKMTLYEVPYLIWTNYDIAEEERNMSANYLSAYLLKVMGANMTGYNKYLLDLQKKVPVITANGYIGDDGVLYGWEDASSYKDVLSEYRMLQYNNLFDSKNRVDEFFYLQ